MKWENLIKSLQVFTCEIFSGDWEDPQAPCPARSGRAAVLCALTALAADAPHSLDSPHSLASFVSSAGKVRQRRTQDLWRRARG